MAHTRRFFIQALLGTAVAPALFRNQEQVIEVAEALPLPEPPHAPFEGARQLSISFGNRYNGGVPIHGSHPPFAHGPGTRPVYVPSWQFVNGKLEVDMFSPLRHEGSDLLIQDVNAPWSWVIVSAHETMGIRREDGTFTRKYLSEEVGPLHRELNEKSRDKFRIVQQWEKRNQKVTDWHLPNLFRTDKPKQVLQLEADIHNLNAKVKAAYTGPSVLLLEPEKVPTKLMAEVKMPEAIARDRLRQEGYVRYQQWREEQQFKRFA